MNIKILLFSFSIFISSFSFAQKTETIKIENGEVYKKYKRDKLDSIVVSMAAVNYGNHLVFTKKDQEILGRSINDEHSLLKFGLKNGKQFKTFFYKKQPIISVETIDFDVNNLPKNAVITGGFEHGNYFYNMILANYEKLGNDNPDKSLKLFHRLNIDQNLTTLESMFDYIAQFFSQEDALLKIYYGKYADKFMPQATAWLKTDSQGKITNGIVWKSNPKDSKNGKSEIYKAGKIIKSGTEDLEKFQKSFEIYMSSVDEL